MKIKIAVFDFTGCEGCELQILNCEEEMPDLLAAFDIVNFREAITDKGNYYDVAFIDGACSRESEIARLHEIRERAKRVIPIGACASLGGVNCLRNSYSTVDALTAVYGESANYYDSIPARPISAVIPIDFFIPGCPIQKEDFIRALQAILISKLPEQYNNPVCAECKMAGNTCVFEKGMTCLGPVTRGGCHATCVTGGATCWGCRGFIDDPNVNAEKEILEKAGLSVAEIMNRFSLFNTFQESIWK